MDEPAPCAGPRPRAHASGHRRCGCRRTFPRVCETSARDPGHGHGSERRLHRQRTEIRRRPVRDDFAVHRPVPGVVWNRASSQLMAIRSRDTRSRPPAWPTHTTSSGSSARRASPRTVAASPKTHGSSTASTARPFARSMVRARAARPRRVPRPGRQTVQTRSGESWTQRSVHRPAGRAAGRTIGAAKHRRRALT